MAEMTNENGFGVVKYYSVRKGYGFILRNDNNADCFFHFSNIISNDPIKALKQGDYVSFSLEEAKEGKNKGKIQAVKVKKIFPEETK